jgi:hypothetical protein
MNPNEITGLDDLPREWQLFVKLAIGEIAALRKANEDIRHAHDNAARDITAPDIGRKMVYEQKVNSYLELSKKDFDAEVSDPNWQENLKKVFIELLETALSRMQSEAAEAN